VFDMLHSYWRACLSVPCRHGWLHAQLLCGCFCVLGTSCASYARGLMLPAAYLLPISSGNSPHEAQPYRQQPAVTSRVLCVLMHVTAYLNA
jgi:hypothetical protein